MESPLHGTRGRNAHRAIPGRARARWRECATYPHRDRTRRDSCASAHQDPSPGSTEPLAVCADAHETCFRFGPRGRAGNSRNTFDHLPQPGRCLGSHSGRVARAGDRLGLVAPCGSQCGAPLVLRDDRSRSAATARPAGCSCTRDTRSVPYWRSAPACCEQVGRARRGTRPRRSKQHHREDQQIQKGR